MSSVDEILAMRNTAQQTGKPVLRRPRPPQAAEEPALCAGLVEVWLKGGHVDCSPTITGYCSQHGVTIRQAGQQESVLLFYSDEALTKLITVKFSEVRFFIVSPLAVTDESPT